MLIRFVTCCMLFAQCWLPSMQAEERTPRVLIIGVDGCRPDALQLAKTPHLDDLINAGTLFEGTDIRKPDGTDKADTISGPGWSNLLCGVWPDKHNVLDNQFTQPNYERYPHVFARLKQARPDAVTASFSTWAPIEEKIVTAADVSRSFGGGSEGYAAEDRAAASACAEYLKTADPDLVVCYQGAVDEAGHSHGFHPSVPRYLAAIEEVDKNIGELQTTIAARKTFSQEDWLIIVCTDHGGRGTGHGGGHSDPEIRTTFLIVSGPAAKQGKSTQPTWQVDVVATALAHLRIPSSPQWELDGHPVGLRADKNP